MPLSSLSRTGYLGLESFLASVLAVVAHPDDEVLGCGGALALHADRGDRVQILILGEGMRSRDEYSEQDVDALVVDAREAARILGADVSFGGLPDNRFDSVALLDVVKIVERMRVEIDPDVVYTHHAGDLNVDHGVTERAVLTAMRPLPGERPRTVLAFDTLSSSEWAFSPALPGFRAQWFVDIGAAVERKAAALEAYRTEIRPAPHPRSREGIEVAARRFGMTAGVAHAEAFEVLRVGPTLPY